MFYTFLATLPDAYLNAAVLAFMIIQIRVHGFIFNPLKVARVLLPLFRCLLFGALPALVVASIFQQLEQPVWLTQATLMLGALVSAVLLHRACLRQVTNSKKCNWLIGILASLQVLFFAITLSSGSFLATS